MAPYPIFFRALKTIIMPNFMLLTESEQFKHISALLMVFLILGLKWLDLLLPVKAYFELMEGLLNEKKIR